MEGKEEGREGRERQYHHAEQRISLSLKENMTTVAVIEQSLSVITMAASLSVGSAIISFPLAALSDESQDEASALCLGVGGHSSSASCQSGASSTCTLI